MEDNRFREDRFREDKPREDKLLEEIINDMTKFYQNKMLTIRSDMTEIKEKHKTFLTYVHKHLKLNYEESLQILLSQAEIIESIKEKLSDDEYLRLINSFKELNDNINTNKISEIYQYINNLV